MKINILDSKPNAVDLADMLRHIAGQLESGMTSGYYPSWEIIAEEHDDSEE